MSDKTDPASEIPDFVKKYIPGVMRGLSWAKYSEEKKKGTVMKSEALQEAYEEGLQAALDAPKGSDMDRILKDTSEELWAKANEFTDEAKKISIEINNQKTKEEREKVLMDAKEAARKAGLQGAIAAGWEKGWKDGVEKRKLTKSD